MSFRNKLVAGLVAALLALGLVRYCDRDRVSDTPPDTLAPHERERIEVKGRIVKVIRADKTTTSYAPGGVKVSVNKDGSVKVDIKRMGFTREPGLGVAFTGEGRLKMSLDMKLAYYRRLGGHLGLTIDYGNRTERFSDVTKLLRPLAVVSYTMPSDTFVNTSLYAGTELFPSTYVVGLRLAF